MEKVFKYVNEGRREIASELCAGLITTKRQAILKATRLNEGAKDRGKRHCKLGASPPEFVSAFA